MMYEILVHTGILTGGNQKLKSIFKKLSWNQNKDFKFLFQIDWNQNVEYIF